MAKTPSGTTAAFASALDSALHSTVATNASESVLTVTGSTLAAGDFVLVASGWGRLNGRVMRVKSATATSLTLEGADTTNTSIFPAGLGVGSVQKITWSAISSFMNLASIVKMNKPFLMACQPSNTPSKWTLTALGPRPTTPSKSSATKKPKPPCASQRPPVRSLFWVPRWPCPRRHPPKAVKSPPTRWCSAAQAVSFATPAKTRA